MCKALDSRPSTIKKKKLVREESGRYLGEEQQREQEDDMAEAE
jgi:hypothetical protein